MQNYDALLRITVRPNLKVILQLGMDERHSDAMGYFVTFLQHMQQLMKHIKWYCNSCYIITRPNRWFPLLSSINTNAIASCCMIQINKQDIHWEKCQSHKRSIPDSDHWKAFYLRTHTDCFYWYVSIFWGFCCRLTDIWFWITWWSRLPSSSTL